MKILIFIALLAIGSFSVPSYAQDECSTQEKGLIEAKFDYANHPSLKNSKKVLDDITAKSNCVAVSDSDKNRNIDSSFAKIDASSEHASNSHKSVANVLPSEPDKPRNHAIEYMQSSAFIDARIFRIQGMWGVVNNSKACYAENVPGSSGAFQCIYLDVGGFLLQASYGRPETLAEYYVPSQMWKRWGPILALINKSRPRNDQAFITDIAESMGPLIYSNILQQFGPSQAELWDELSLRRIVY